MTRIALLFAAFITLHTPSGREVFVNADEIMVIRNTLNPPWGCGGGSEIIVHDKEVCVKEYPHDVIKLVEGAKQ